MERINFVCLNYVISRSSEQNGVTHNFYSHTGARQLVPEFSRMSVRSFDEDEDGGRMDHVRVGVDSDGAQADRARLRRGQSGMKTRPSLK